MIGTTRKRRGQATLEFAMVLPIIIIVVLGMQWAGAGIINDISVTDAAQSGAQAAANALDQVDSALSCTPPASYECVQSAEDVITQMVDAALPCGPGQANECKTAAYNLEQVALNWGVPFCLHFAEPPIGLGGCNTIPALRVFALMNAAKSCSGLGCKAAAENLAKAAMEAGLGCFDGTDCPPPLLTPGSPCAVHPHSCPSPDCIHPVMFNGSPVSTGCSRPVMLELIGGFAQLGIACAAIRHSLEPTDPSLNKSVTCRQNTDPNLWINTQTLSVGSADIPYIPWTCIHTGAVPAHFFLEDLCPHVHETVVLKVTVHYTPPNHSSPVVASASAVPVGQFSTG